MTQMNKQSEGMGDSLRGAAAWCQDYATALRDGRFKPFSKTERKARAATRNKPWGPTGTELNELAELTYSPADCHVVMEVLAFRLGYPPAKWRNVYKALTVLEFLLRRGSDASVSLARQRFTPQLEALRRFAYVSPDGRDLGQNVQHRSAAILALLGDEERLAAEREAVQKKRAVFDGFSREHMLAATASVNAESDSGSSRAADGMADGAGSGRGGRWASADGAGVEPTSPSLRGAGETKGVSHEANARHLAALRRLLDWPENRSCADCSPGTAPSASRSSWASINTGVFLCMRCAGIHRGLGVHVSKVRSCSLDTWLPEQVEFMAHTGNAVANSYWEAALPGGPEGRPRHADLAEQETFIRRKYVAREFVRGSWPPSEVHEDARTRSVLAELRMPLAGSAAAAAMAAPAAEQVQVAGPAPTTSAAAADLISLLDLDAEPRPAADVAAEAAARGAAEARAAAADPLNGLQTVLGAGQGNGASVPLTPADLASWDMGVVAGASEPARPQQQAPAPPAYRPPWAPDHPEHRSLAQWQQQQPGSLMLMPPGAAFQQQPSLGYQPSYLALPAPPTAAPAVTNGWTTPVNGWATEAVAPLPPQLSTVPAVPGRNGMPALQIPLAQRPTPLAAPSPVAPSPGSAPTPPSADASRHATPATPVDKANDLLRGSLDSFLSHSETVSARKLSPGPASSYGSSTAMSLSALKRQQSPGEVQQPAGGSAGHQGAPWVR